MQFKEFLDLESTLTFALMDRDNNRSISSQGIQTLCEIYEDIIFCCEPASIIFYQSKYQNHLASYLHRSNLKT